MDEKKIVYCVQYAPDRLGILRPLRVVEQIVNDNFEIKNSVWTTVFTNKEEAEQMLQWAKVGYNQTRKDYLEEIVERVLEQE